MPSDSRSRSKRAEAERAAIRSGDGRQSNDGFLDRISRVIRFDRRVWAEIAASESATGQAAAIVVASMVSSALVSFVGSALGGFHSNNPLFDAVVNPLSNLLWVTLQVGLITFLGRVVTGSRVGIQPTFRIVGFSYLPCTLQIMLGIPITGPFIVLVASIWNTVLTYFGIRHGLGIPRWRAWLILIVLVILLTGLSVPFFRIQELLGVTYNYGDDPFIGGGF
jgi:hypothetical protein